MAGRNARRVRKAKARALEGTRPYSEVTEAVQDALEQRYAGVAGMPSPWVWVRDLTDTWVVYDVEGPEGCVTYQVNYTLGDTDSVAALTGDPVEVEPKTEYVPSTEPPEPAGDAVTEGRLHRKAKAPETSDYLGSRVVEAKGTDEAGGRIFGMQLIEVGTSKNGVRYTEAVLSTAAPLYEGAKSFDHHRSDVELRSSSITGLCGYWRNVTAAPDGLHGDLHLLPGATHVAEALDASIDAQNAGLPPVIGVSHDVRMVSRDSLVGGRHVREAVEIKSVGSVDVVADPSAGGRVHRAVAGGTGIDPDMGDTMTLKELLAALRDAKTAEARTALLAEHGSGPEAAGLDESDLPPLPEPAKADAKPEPEPKPDKPEPEPAPAPEPEKGELVAVAEAHVRDSIVGRMLIREAVKDAGLTDEFVSLVTGQLPDRITESSVQGVVKAVQTTAVAVEKASLRPTHGHTVRVTEADVDKRKAKLLASFEGNWQEGYTSIQEAYLDITGRDPRAMFKEDLAAEIIRESHLGPQLGAPRVTESIASSTWGFILADVLNKRMVSAYTTSNLMAWKQLVNVVPLNNFRSQKLIRFGGYGTLPTVNEGAPYQSLTTPTDEQVTYSPSKKGGIEDYTYEMARNDDLRRLTEIPTKLARAAAQTLYRAIFDIFVNNPTMGYDSVALFHASHNNTTAGTALSEAGMDTLRQKMRSQAAYGDTYEVLGLTPRFVIVPNPLENTANKIANGPALSSTAGSYASDQPNLHVGITPIVVDYWTDPNDYFVMADPADVPTIEVGFLDGKVTPELFVQDDPNVGSMFAADKATWKVRHIWGYAPVDHRGLQRMTN